MVNIDTTFFQTALDSPKNQAKGSHSELGLAQDLELKHRGSASVGHRSRCWLGDLEGHSWRGGGSLPASSPTTICSPLRSPLGGDGG